MDEINNFYQYYKFIGNLEENSYHKFQNFLFSKFIELLSKNNPNMFMKYSYDILTSSVLNEEQIYKLKTIIELNELNMD